MTIRGDKFQSIGFDVTESFTPAGGPALQGPPSQSLIYRWHRAELINVITSSGEVTQWNDISGKNNHLTQSVASDRPTWIQSTSSFNNQSAVQFDGTDHFMVDLHTALTGSGITFAASFRGNNLSGVVDGIMSFVRPGVSDFTATDAFNYNTGRKSPPSLDDEIEIGPDAGTGDNVFLGDSMTGKTGWTVIRMEGGSVDVLRQLLTGSLGTHVTASNFAATWDITKMMIGARDPSGNESIVQHFRGDYFEMIVYQTALNDDEMSALDNYMSASLAGTLSGSATGSSITTLNPKVSLDEGKLTFGSFIDQSGISAAILTNAPSASNPAFWVPVETPSGSGAIPIWT